MRAYESSRKQTDLKQTSFLSTGKPTWEVVYFCNHRYHTTWWQHNQRRRAASINTYFSARLPATLCSHLGNFCSSQRLWWEQLLEAWGWLSCEGDPSSYPSLLPCFSGPLRITRLILLQEVSSLSHGRPGLKGFYYSQSPCKGHHIRLTYTKQAGTKLPGRNGKDPVK